jgi:uncharacterized protein YjbJ (UPF0337 family)
MIEMNSDVLNGEWKQLSGWIKETWGRVTDDDLTEIGGRFEQLVGKVQERYGLEYEQALADVRAWSSRIQARAETTAKA